MDDTDSKILPGLIVLEGLDGAGTTTQAALLHQALIRVGRKACLTCEPTAHPIGRLIRSVIRGEIEATPRSLALLFAADRDVHLYAPESGMEDACKRGEWVISDRYLHSSLAYQSLETPYETVEALNRFFPAPQMIVFIDTPVEICMRRLEGRAERDRFEQLEVQKRVCQAYERAFSTLSSECTLLRVDGTLPIETLGSIIFDAVMQLPRNITE